MNGRNYHSRNNDYPNDAITETPIENPFATGPLNRNSLPSTLDVQNSNPSEASFIVASTDGRIQRENPSSPFPRAVTLGEHNRPDADVPDRDRVLTSHQSLSHHSSPRYFSKEDGKGIEKEKNNHNLPHHSASSGLPDGLSPLGAFPAPYVRMGGDSEAREGETKDSQIRRSRPSTSLNPHSGRRFVDKSDDHIPTTSVSVSHPVETSEMRGHSAGVRSGLSVNFYDQHRIETEAVKVDGAEELMEVPVIPTRPMDKFFVHCHKQPTSSGGAQYPEGMDFNDPAELRDEDEMLFAQFAQFTDDDSFFSDSASLLEDKPMSTKVDPLQLHSTKSVHETLRLHSLSNGRFKKDYDFNHLINAPWLYQVHANSLALRHSSFIFPPRWTPRVIVYNIMHHWLYEIILFFMILGYCIFQATWARYSAPEGKMIKPDYMLGADVLFTTLFAIELLFALFAKGFFFHPRAFFRSPWGWLDTAVFVMIILECTDDQRLWNFTAWRLIRCIKCLTRVPLIVHLKISAKSLLRSTNGLVNVCILLLYFIFFFALLGLQLFSGVLHGRCVNKLTDRVTDQICRTGSTGEHWVYRGHHCDEGYVCIQDTFPNPHYDFRSFDDIGHAMLSTFQIMTFQGWAGLLKETSDAITVAVFLYYFFTILLCTWIIPSLFLGVFIMKIEKTSRFFAIKQLNVFNDVLLEHRRSVNAAVRLRDYVKRDKNGRVTHYPAYAPRHDDDDDGTPKYRFPGSKSKPRSVRGTHWTDERRLQLHLSLSRHRAVAEDAEQMHAELTRKPYFSDSVTSSAVKRITDRPGTHDGIQESSAISVARPDTGVSPEAQEPDNFALGGRVGAVQYHPKNHTTGASVIEGDPFAVRQNAKSKDFRFLDPFADYNDWGDIMCEDDHDNPELPLENEARAFSIPLVTASNITPRPPSSPGTNVRVTRESVGVVPPRHSISDAPTIPHTYEQYCANAVGGSSMNLIDVSAPEYASEMALIQDPEGGELSLTDTCWGKFNIIRNILHMFTEAYPRILTEYMWKHKMMRYRCNLLPLKYANMYEEKAIQEFRRRQVNKHIKTQVEMHRYDMFHDLEEQKAHDGTGGDVNHHLRDNGKLASWSMPLMRMAENIKQNAPISNFNFFMYVLIFLNAVFNATRFDTMPDVWEKGTFFAGIIFSSFFVLELLIRIVAIGPGPFLVDGFNLIEFVSVMLSLFQLGFSRSNTISLFNWIRFLKLLRVCPVRPTRHVFQVLIRAIPGMTYAFIFFSLYAFMWVLLGMSFFGSRTNWIDAKSGDYHTRANFETFSHAVFAVSQTFSLNRDQWLYLSWNGMRVRGGYTILYFIFTALTALIFRFFFIAIFLWAWKAQEEHGMFMGEGMDREDTNTPLQDSRYQHYLPWFDFTIWRSFKHIHGGFERRNVAPDEVYYINEDMQRELHFVQSRDSSHQNMHKNDYTDHTPADQHEFPPLQTDSQSKPSWSGPQYFSVGDQLYPQTILYDTDPKYDKRTLYENKAQLRFARERLFVPADIYGHRAQVMTDAPLNPNSSSPEPALPLTGVACASSESNIQSPPQFFDLATSSHENPAVQPLQEDGPLRHLLLPGPRMRYKSIFQSGRRVFEYCQNCNAHKEIPLRSAPGVAQRTADDLHAEHCHTAAVRSSRQLVLNAMLGYVRLQKSRNVKLTTHMVEVVLGQAWSCGMLLSENIDNLSCTDMPQEERSWDRLLQALEIQQWLLELHVGEEQVGRATLAYILAHQHRKEKVAQESKYTESWKDRSFMVPTPSDALRCRITSIVESLWFQIFIFVTILISSICLATYTPGEYNRDMGGDYNSGKYKFLHLLDDIFTLIFAAEMLLKWVSMGVVVPIGRAYFWHLWNIFDCFIVISSLVSWFSRGVFLRYLKVLRCFRILGPLQYWTGNPSMIPIARTLWNCIPILVNICLAMLMNYAVWAIIFTSMFMNKMNTCSNVNITSYKECVENGFQWKPATRNFDNFYESLLTTFEVSTGAEWLNVIYNAVDSWSTELAPVVNRHPYKGLVFVAYYYISHFFLITFFISAMIYTYFVSKNTTGGMKFGNQLWFRIEEGLLRIKPKIRMIPTTSTIPRFFHRILSSQRFELFMSFILWLNMLTMALQWYHMADAQKATLTAFNAIFVVIFTIEVLMRLIAYGLRFFSRWTYCWDLLVVFLSYIQFILNSTRSHHMPFDVNVLRLLRLFRVLRLFNLATCSRTHLMLLGEVLQASVPSLINVTMIYMFSVYVFAIVGLHFLGYIVPYAGYIDGKYDNFMTFVNSLIMVFRLSTLQDWATMLRASLDRGNYCGKSDHRCGPTNFAPLYYIAIVVLFFLMIGSLYIAVIIDHYISAVRMRDTFTRLKDLYYFCELWSRRDPNARLTLPATKIPKILQELHPPLGIRDLHNRAELLRLLREYDIPLHNGYVHYYAVLFPLARRALSMSVPTDLSLGETPEVSWRPAKPPLQTAPELRYVEPSAPTSRHTLAEWYAVSYIQAAYRRNRAMRDYIIAKSKLWHAGRAECLRQGLPYSDFGFGAQRLDSPDPLEEGRRRGFNVAEDAAAEGAPVFAGTASKRALQAELQSRENRARALMRSGAEGGVVVLPVVHHTAIRPEEERFGPNAPNAVRRYERRTEKLRRRRELEAREELVARKRGVSHGVVGDIVIHRESPIVNPLSPDQSAVQADGFARSALSSRPEGASSNIRRIRVIAVSPTLDHRGGSVPMPDPGSPSYQPPLGTDPEVFRSEEISRRSRPGSTQ